METSQSLNLRWNNKVAIIDANLVKNVFCPPNCADPSPGGMVFWRELIIKDKIVRVTIFDETSNNVAIEIKNVKKLDKMNSSFLGYNYIPTSDNSCILKGDGVKDTLGLFVLVISLELGMSMIKANAIYNQIQNMTDIEFEKSLVSPKESKKEEPVENKEYTPGPNIPKIDQTKNIEETTNYPQPLREVIKPEPTSLPTLVGSHPMATVMNCFNPNNNNPGLYQSSNACVRTPDGVPVHVTHY